MPVLLIAALTAPVAAEPVSRAATGDLGVSVWAITPGLLSASAAPGDTIIYWVSYEWEGEEAATGVQVVAELPADVDVVGVYPPETTRLGLQMTWQVGALDAGGDAGSLVLTTIVRENVPTGTVLPFRATIAGDVTDEDPGNNTAESEITVEAGAPSFFLWAMPAVEDVEWLFAFFVEKEVPFTVGLTYGNFSGYEAPDARITIEMPAGISLSAPSPPATSAGADRVEWALGTLAPWEFSELTFTLQANVTGEFEVPIIMSSYATDGTPVADTTTLAMDVRDLMQPRLLKPAASSSDEAPLILGANPRFEGLARAGATVTLYEGPDFCMGPLEGCHPVPLGSAVAGADRRWTIVPTEMTEARTYYLYLRAEYEGRYSEPTSLFFLIWDPVVVTVDSLFSGFDFDNFTVGNGDIEYHPGALGGRSGALPDEDYVVKMRMAGPDGIPDDPQLLENHRLVFKIRHDDREDSLSVLPTEIVRVGGTSTPGTGTVRPAGIDWWGQQDFIYVQKGFGPGSIVEVWCRPVWYPDNPGEIPIVGLVWVKCHETVIDPAGYVYDHDTAGGCDFEWPEIPPDDALVTNAEVTALQRQGDASWGVWDASATGQVNPQVTDATTPDRITIPGYFAFYVPPGQYQVQSVAPGYVDYLSPMLTVVDSPVFHNVCMRRSTLHQVGINRPHIPRRIPEPGGFVLDQNFPNPFNASTVIQYELSAVSEVFLRVYDVVGREVTRLDAGRQLPGLHQVRFDASSLPSGVYFYRLQVGEQSQVRSMTIVR